MSALFECLDRLADQRLGTVVHVNPTQAEVVERYATLSAHRVVLVSGDADALPQLHRATAGRPWLEIVEAAVSPAPGTADWLRYNVPGLSGLLEPAALQDFYPRLHLVERVPVTTISLQSVLDGLHVATEADRPNLLVLEAPGMDAPLLESLAVPTLRAFTWLMVRSARQDLYVGGVADTAAARLLQTRAYRNVHESRDAEPLWPVTLLHFDAPAAERAALAARVNELQAEVERLAAARDECEQRATEWQRRAEMLVQEHRARLDALAQAKLAAERAAAEREAQIDHLSGVRDAEIRVLAQAKAAAEELARERQAQLDVLGQAKAAIEKELADRVAQIEQLSNARDEQMQRVVERDAKVHALSQAKASSDKDVTELTAQLEQIARARDEQAKLAAERATQLSKIEAEKASLQDKLTAVAQLESSHAELQVRQRLMDEEMIRAEGQIELIKDILLREAGL
jgi:hypothetical protein